PALPADGAHKARAAMRSENRTDLITLATLPQPRNTFCRSGDLGDANPEVVLDHDNLALCYQPAVDKQVDRLAGDAIELDYRSGRELQHVLNQHADPAQLDRYVERNVKDHVETAGQRRVRAGDNQVGEGTRA